MSRSELMADSRRAESESDDDRRKRLRAARNRRLGAIMRIFNLITNPLAEPADPPPQPPVVEPVRQTKRGQGGSREGELTGPAEAAVMNHLARRAAATASEVEAGACVGALPMLAAALVPGAAPSILRAAPTMVSAMSGAARVLRESVETRGLVRSLPRVAQRTARRIDHIATRGRPVSPDDCVRILAGTAVQVLREAAADAETSANTSYDGLGLRALRTLARTDRQAADALWGRYQGMSDATLQRRIRLDDGMARAVLSRRPRPNDVALQRAREHRRQPHSANVIRYRPNAAPWRRSITSGNATPEERRRHPDRLDLGYATHTEARAVRMANLKPGDLLSIIGQYDPCPRCRQLMHDAARRSGATIRYAWMGGTATFPP